MKYGLLKYPHEPIQRLRYEIWALRACVILLAFVGAYAAGKCQRLSQELQYQTISHGQGDGL